VIENSPQVKLIIAIPTFNRLEKLKVLLNSISAQVPDATYTCSLAIANSYSTDGTYEYLESLHKVGCITDILKFNKRADEKSSYPILLNGLPENWNNLAYLIPDGDHWVWLMGDDDYLVSPNCLGRLASLVANSTGKDVDLIHLTQARRSTGSKKIIKEAAINAANTLGFLELLGWMSSLVVRGDVLKQAFLCLFYEERDDPALTAPSSLPQILRDKVSAFRQSSLILRRIVGSNVLIVDDYFAEPQDESQTAESIKRWQAERVSLRYMFVVDDIEYLRRTGVLNADVSAVFFRYHAQFIWDRFTQYVVTHLSYSGELDDYCLAFMERIARIEQLLSSPSEIHLYRLWRFCFFTAVEDAIKTRKRYLESCGKLEEMVHLGFRGVFKFDTLQ